MTPELAVVAAILLCAAGAVLTAAVAAPMKHDAGTRAGRAHGDHGYVLERKRRGDRASGR